MGGGPVRSGWICLAAGHSGDEGSESGKGKGRLSSKGMKTTSTWSPSSSGGVLLWFCHLSPSSLSRHCISLWVNNVKKQKAKTKTTKRTRKVKTGNILMHTWKYRMNLSHHPSCQRCWHVKPSHISHHQLKHTTNVMQW